MRTIDLWKKMINARIYTKEVASLRVNTVFAVGQLSPNEYTELVELIDAKYSETA